MSEYKKCDRFIFHRWMRPGIQGLNFNRGLSHHEPRCITCLAYSRRSVHSSIIVAAVVALRLLSSKPLSSISDPPTFLAPYSQPPHSSAALVPTRSPLLHYPSLSTPWLFSLPAPQGSSQIQQRLGPHSVSPQSLSHFLEKPIIMNHFLPGPNTKSILDNTHQFWLPTDLFRWDKLPINSHFFQVRERSSWVTQGALWTSHQKLLQLLLFCSAGLPVSLQTQLFLQMIHRNKLSPKAEAGLLLWAGIQCQSDIH